MLKHHDWVSNRGYQQHLNVLTKIYTRNGISQPVRQSLSHSPQKPATPGRPPSSRQLLSVARSKENLTMRDQKILWDNYHLGKRIIETPPVISKRKQDQDFRKHKRLVRGLTSSSRKLKPSDFRVKKLQEYKQNVEQLGQDRALQTVTHKYYLRLQISVLSFYRQRPLLDQLIVVLTHYTKEGKPRRHKSESFPAQELIDRSFFFSLPKRLIGSEEPLTIELQQMKGLQQMSVGYFSFPSRDGQIKAQMFHCGKPIGEVVVASLSGKREDGDFSNDIYL